MRRPLENILELKNLSKVYTGRKSEKRALDGVRFAPGPPLSAGAPGAAGRVMKKNVRKKLLSLIVCAALVLEAGFFAFAHVFLSFIPLLWKMGKKCAKVKS